MFCLWLVVMKYQREMVMKNRMIYTVGHRKWSIKALTNDFYSRFKIYVRKPNSPLNTEFAITCYNMLVKNLSYSVVKLSGDVLFLLKKIRFKVQNFVIPNETKNNNISLKKRFESYVNIILSIFIIYFFTHFFVITTNKLHMLWRFGDFLKRVTEQAT